MKYLKQLVAWGVILTLVVGIFLPPITSYASQRQVATSKSVSYKRQKDVRQKKSKEHKKTKKSNFLVDLIKRTTKLYGSQKMKKIKNKINLKQIAKNINVNMHVDEPCGLTYKEFKKLLKYFKYDYVGFLRRNAKHIWKCEQKYHINALFYCGIFGYESGWGQCGWSHNYTGMIGMRFSSDKEGIEATFKNLSKNYISRGRTTISQIGRIYCESGGWDEHVASCMRSVVTTRKKK